MYNPFPISWYQRFGLAIMLAIPLVSLLIISQLPLQAQTPPNAANATNSFFLQQWADKPQKLTPRLQLMAQNATQLGGFTPQAEAELLSVTEAGPGSLLKNPQGRLLVYIRVRDLSATTLVALATAGAEVVDIASEYQTVTAFVEPAHLPAVANIGAVLSLQEEFAPLKIDDSIPSALAASLSPMACPGGAVTSEGDTHLRAAEARTRFNVDGTGITVGVLSDSFARTSTGTTASQDISTGDLPGAGNPCGRLSAVRVISESVRTNNFDEGRAMLQLVHDLSPGANLQFATAAHGVFAFSKNIRALRTLGADILVDDISYLIEPFYQDGPVSVAIADVVKQGALYFTAAGNSNLTLNGNRVGSYETPAFRPTNCPLGFPSTVDKCHDFDPGTGADHDNTITIGPNGGIVLLLQWAQPWSGVTTDYDLLLLNQLGSIVAGGITPNKVTQTPVDALGYLNDTGIPQSYRVVIARYRGVNGTAGDDKTPRFKFIVLGSLGVQTVEYAVGNGGDIVGPTVFGHSATANAISVGAVSFSNTTTLEDFSSLGPATLYFGPVQNNTPAPPLASPQRLEKPDVAATDGTVTTFLGPPDNQGKRRFFGTSASASHTAAVAALLLQHGRPLGYQPSQASMEALLETSARPLLVTTSPVLSTPLGLLDAVAAITILETTIPSITSPPTGQVSVNPGQSATLSVVGSGAPPLQYQWYQGSSGDTSMAISNSTMPTLTTPSLFTTTHYWVRVSNLHGRVDSATVTVLVNPGTLPVITQQPTSQTLQHGATATLRVVAEGTAPLAYQWYQGNSGDTSSPLAGATSSEFTTLVLTTTTSFWVRVSNSMGSVDSATVIITVLPPVEKIQIIQQPISQTISSGQTATLSVTATGPDLTYQWYQGITGDTSNPISGATAHIFTTPPLTTTTSFWVQISNAQDSVNSETVTITVRATRSYFVFLPIILRNSPPSMPNPIDPPTATPIFTPTPTMTPTPTACPTHSVLLPGGCATVTPTFTPTSTPTTDNVKRIAFQSDRDGNHEIYSMKPDGSAIVNLSKHPQYDANPVWSPDGKKIAFISGRDGDSAIYLMNADGSNQIRVTNSPTDTHRVSWAPDSQKLAYESDYKIHVINLDGTGHIQLTHPPSFDVNPAWSPDGTKIAFSRGGILDGEIYTISPDGANLTNLTKSLTSEDDPAWSRDGSKIVYGRNFFIWIMNKDGSGQTQITKDRNWIDRYPAWSNDRLQIVYSSLPNPGSFDEEEIYVINADGTGRTQLTDNHSYDGSPDWQP